MYEKLLFQSYRTTVNDSAQLWVMDCGADTSWTLIFDALCGKPVCVDCLFCFSRVSCSHNTNLELCHVGRFFGFTQAAINSFVGDAFLQYLYYIDLDAANVQTMHGCIQCDIARCFPPCRGSVCQLHYASRHKLGDLSTVKF